MLMSEARNWKRALAASGRGGDGMVCPTAAALKDAAAVKGSVVSKTHATPLVCSPRKTGKTTIKTLCAVTSLAAETAIAAQRALELGPGKAVIGKLDMSSGC
ncbi:hypothetical protein [Kitasatospora aureofaciens]|uniref:hypothetical protein n=1 Tax=Kitasatospora aureofaciens TaxID=1894 RepID=UPI0036F49341